MMVFLRDAMMRALRNMKGNLFPNLTTIGIIAITILLFSTFSLIAFNLTSFLKNWEDKIEVIAYLRKEISSNEVAGLLEKVRLLRGVESVKYVSSSEAMAFMEAQLGPQKNLLDGVKPAVLPSSFEIQLKKDYRVTARIKELVSQLRPFQQIEEIQYGQEWVETFSVLVHILRMTQWILGGLLLAAMIFIISNTLQMTISSRREEIEIMHMVGANPSFIQIPFYIEGLLQGLFGAGLAMLGLLLLYKIFFFYITPLMKGWLAGIAILFLPYESIAWILSGGMVLGIFGSFIASMRILRYSG
jgi:cell division transport system permease protein